VLNNQVVIGDYCTLRHFTTIGNKQKPNGATSGSPVIGNYVEVGSNACIIGEIVIGDQVTIGCGSVVTKSVLANAIVVGNPAAQIKTHLQAIEVPEDLQQANINLS
jgi:putative colanic acid biosynthesis acetyltransferase WcaB